MKSVNNEKTWREPDWRRAFGPDPAGYDLSIERTLSEFREERPMKRKIAASTVLIAAIITILLAGTALALGNAFGIRDFMREYFGLTPKPDAAPYISQALGSAETSSVRMTVPEAVYDGATVRAIIRVEALEPDKYIIIDDVNDEDSYFNGMDGETIAEYASRTGRELINIHEVNVSVDNAQEASGTFIEAREGDAFVVYAEMNLGGESPERASMYVGLETEEQCAVSFHLDKVTVNSALLTPETAPDAGFTILSARQTDTPFAAYLQIVYTVEGTPYEQIAELIDSDATYYATKHGIYAHLEPDCSGMANASPLSGKEVIAGEKIPCPFCTGADISFISTPARWDFELLDSQKQPVSIAGSNGGEVLMEDGTKAFSVTCVIQQGDFPDGTLYLKPTSPNGEAGPLVAVK